MPRTCTICAHSKKADIDQALIKGDALRDIAGQYNLSKSSLQRHKDEHLPQDLAKAQEAMEVTESSDLLGQLGDIIQRTKKVLDRAETGGNDRMLLMAIREARGNLELSAKIQLVLNDRAKAAGLLPGDPEVHVYLPENMRDIDSHDDNYLAAIESKLDAIVRRREAVKNTKDNAGAPIIKPAAQPSPTKTAKPVKAAKTAPAGRSPMLAASATASVDSRPGSDYLQELAARRAGGDNNGS